MKLHSVVFALLVSLVITGCGHHKHHREEGEKHRHKSEHKEGRERERGHKRESLTGKVIRYPFRMTGYALSAPFHPFKATRKAVDATLDVPEKALDSTAEALFGHGGGHDRKRRHRDREEEHEEREHDEEEEEESEEHGGDDDESEEKEN